MQWECDRKATALDPKNAAFFTARGWVLEQQDDDQRALANYEKALAIDPGLQSAQEARDRILTLIVPSALGPELTAEALR